MAEFAVTFLPQQQTISVPQGSSLLEAALKSGFRPGSLCGGHGLCGRCRMIVKHGRVSGESGAKLSQAEISKGYVLACLSRVESHLTVEIPPALMTGESPPPERFREQTAALPVDTENTMPLVRKIHLQLAAPDLWNNTALHQLLCTEFGRSLNLPGLQLNPALLPLLPALLEDYNYDVTATVALREEQPKAEIIELEGGNTESASFMLIVDIGTTTIAAELVETGNRRTVAAAACYNSQGACGRDLTSRIMAAEKQGTGVLQQLVEEDLNKLIQRLTTEAAINPAALMAVVCAGNTVMQHFLLGLPTRTIRRSPYIPVTVEAPALPAASRGIAIHPRGLVYTLPCISGWVGGDLSAGILATGMHLAGELCLLVDIGTNGEIIVGNREWLVAASASAGPALEGANSACGMRAETGAIEKVFAEEGCIRYSTIGGAPPVGICGSGIIDLLSVLLTEQLIDRMGKFTGNRPAKLRTVDGIKRFVLAGGEQTPHRREIYITELDLENIITAKAAIYAAMKILLKRLDLPFTEIRHFYIAGAFGNYLELDNAIAIGLIPELARDRFRFAGNTSLKGARLAALSHREFAQLRKIREKTTYYDLMGAADYIEEFKKALFLPHTDIEEFTMSRQQDG